MPARFDRYRHTAGYNAVINSRQFRGGGTITPWPTNYWPPSVIYRDRLDLRVGDQRFALRHARGETDDATWVFAADRRVLCTGDLFVWVTPNAGNPQKVQRYAGEWAIALRAMASEQPELLLPGHGPPIVGADRVQQALGDTAAYLETLEAGAVAMMNEGAALDEIVSAVSPPFELLGRPYLLPIYDEPEFIVRNVWRLNGGWYNGQAAHLKPAPETDLGAEVANLAGGADALIARASELAEVGEPRMAGHLADWAYQAAPDDAAVREAPRPDLRTAGVSGAIHDGGGHLPRHGARHGNRAGRRVGLPAAAASPTELDATGTIASSSSYGG